MSPSTASVPSQGKVILKKLGGPVFILMTGAKRVLAGNNLLSFMIPAGRETSINRVEIHTEPNGKYSMYFYHVEEVEQNISRTWAIEHRTGISSRDLQSTFTAVTGLATGLKTDKGTAA
jgi:hypothetical protein